MFRFRKHAFSLLWNSILSLSWIARFVLLGNDELDIVYHHPNPRKTRWCPPYAFEKGGFRVAFPMFELFARRFQDAFVEAPVLISVTPIQLLYVTLFSKSALQTWTLTRSLYSRWYTCATPCASLASRQMRCNGFSFSCSLLRIPLLKSKSWRTCWHQTLKHQFKGRWYME